MTNTGTKQSCTISGDGACSVAAPSNALCSSAPAYSQSTYYSEGSYYSQSTYYAQGSYSPPASAEVSIATYPDPPIIPSTGMKPNDPATMTLTTTGFDKNYCYLEGGTLANKTSLASLQTSGDMTSAGVYEPVLPEKGTVEYRLYCYWDSDGDGTPDDGNVTEDSVIFRILPKIQET